MSQEVTVANSFQAFWYSCTGFWLSPLQFKIWLSCHLLIIHLSALLIFKNHVTLVSSSSLSILLYLNPLKHLMNCTSPEDSGGSKISHSYLICRLYPNTGCFFLLCSSSIFLIPRLTFSAGVSGKQSAHNWADTCLTSQASLYKASWESDTTCGQLGLVTVLQLCTKRLPVKPLGLEETQATDCSPEPRC